MTISTYNFAYPDDAELWGAPDTLVPVAEFIRSCRTRERTDDHGHGHPARASRTNLAYIIMPSLIEAIPFDTTHILWIPS